MPFFGCERAARCREPVLAFCLEPVPAFCLEPVVFGLVPVALRFEAPLALRADPPADFCAVPLALRADPPADFCAVPLALRADPPADFWVFGEAAISVLLPAAAARRGLPFPFPAVSGKVPELIPGRLQRTLCLVLGAALLHISDKIRQGF